MKDNYECMLCETKFKVDDAFKQIFCVDCEYNKEREMK